jgi:hypothetical protein
MIVAETFGASMLVVADAQIQIISKTEKSSIDLAEMMIFDWRRV